MNRGFTLIELLISIFILSILASVAVPTYQSFMARGYRSDARAALLIASSWMERNYLANNCYSKTSPSLCADSSEVATIANATLTAAGLGQSPKEGAAVYNITFSAGPTETTYTLQAAPVGGGAMATDACGTFTIDQLGTKGRSGTESLANCWQQ